MIRYEAMASILPFFRNKLNKFNKTEHDSIYHDFKLALYVQFCSVPI